MSTNPLTDGIPVGDEQEQDSSYHLFGEIISEYSRATALEDGFLVDLNQWIPVSESGYKYPVACTSTVFSVIQDAVEKQRKDYKGVIWDILWMSQRGVVQRWDTGCKFQVRIGRSMQTLKIECGPGDDLSPVLTIMFPDED